MIHDTLILEILLLGLMCVFLYNSLNNMKINISWAIFLSGTTYVLPLDSAQLPGDSHMQTPEASISSQAHGAPRWGGYSDGHVCQETVIRHHTETVFRTHEYPPWTGGPASDIFPPAPSHSNCPAHHPLSLGSCASGQEHGAGGRG